MISWLAVGIGGAIGSIVRYLVGEWASGKLGAAFPWGTLLINGLGSLVLGVIVGATAAGRLPPSGKLLLGTGFCGGFTTFSTFSVETMALLEKNELATAALYLTSSVGLGLAGAALGLFVGR